MNCDREAACYSRFAVMRTISRITRTAVCMPSAVMCS